MISFWVASFVLYISFDFKEMFLSHFCGQVNYPVLCCSTGILIFWKVLKNVYVCVCVYILFVANILLGLLFISYFLFHKYKSIAYFKNLIYHLHFWCLEDVKGFLHPQVLIFSFTIWVLTELLRLSYPPGICLAVQICQFTYLWVLVCCVPINTFIEIHPTYHKVQFIAFLV